MGLGKNFRSGKFVTLWGIVLLTAVLLAAKPVKRMRDSAWKPSLKRKLAESEAAPIPPAQTAAPAGTSAALRESAAVGIYVKDIDTGEEFRSGPETRWYLASGIKVPVAIAVLRAAERGAFSLDTELELGENDKLDGSGSVERLPAGTKLTVRYLLEEMITWSDNTATDMLLRLVGVGAVNAGLAEWVPGEFGPVTTLFDVRRRVYCGVHPACEHLTGTDFRALKDAGGDAGRLEYLETRLGLGADSLPRGSLAKAYSDYYRSGANSATLPAYGRLLERLARGELLSHANTVLLLGIMTRVHTGEKRLKAALPEDAIFAHKTGTQRERVCDFGIVVRGEKRLIAIACASGFPRQETAEAALRVVGEALVASGALGAPPVAVQIAKRTAR